MTAARRVATAALPATRPYPGPFRPLAGCARRGVNLGGRDGAAGAGSGGLAMAMRAGARL